MPPSPSVHYICVSDVPSFLGILAGAVAEAEHSVFPQICWPNQLMIQKSVGARMHRFPQFTTYQLRCLVEHPERQLGILALGRRPAYFRPTEDLTNH